MSSATPGTGVGLFMGLQRIELKVLQEVHLSFDKGSVCQLGAGPLPSRPGPRPHHTPFSGVYLTTSVTEPVGSREQQ